MFLLFLVLKSPNEYRNVKYNAMENTCLQCTEGRVFTNESLNAINGPSRTFDKHGCHYSIYNRGVYGCGFCHTACSLIAFANLKHNDTYEGLNEVVPHGSIKYHRPPKAHKQENERLTRSIGTGKKVRVWTYNKFDKHFVFSGYFTIHQRINEKERNTWVTLQPG